MSLFDELNPPKFTTELNTKWVVPEGRSEMQSVDINGFSAQDRRSEIANQLLIRIGSQLVAEAMDRLEAPVNTFAPGVKQNFYRTLGEKTVLAIDLFLEGAMPLEKEGDGDGQ